MHRFLAEEFASVNDYLGALTAVQGNDDATRRISDAIDEAFAQAGTVMSFAEQTNAEEFVAETFLVQLPEADFRRAMFKATANMSPSPASKSSRICQNRLIEWEFIPDYGFRWIGDEEVAARAVRPALTAIEDPRFAGRQERLRSCTGRVDSRDADRTQAMRA